MPEISNFFVDKKWAKSGQMPRKSGQIFTMFCKNFRHQRKNAYFR